MHSASKMLLAAAFGVACLLWPMRKGRRPIPPTFPSPCPPTSNGQPVP